MPWWILENELDEPRRQLFLLYAVLAVVCSQAIERRDVHHAWVAWMELQGEVHRSMVPLEELSAPVQAEDDPFVEAIRRVSARLAGASMDAGRAP
jgi:hypothetical protein